MKVILRDSLESRTSEQEETIKEILKNNSGILQRTTETDVLPDADVILIHDEITSLRNAEINKIKEHSWIINYHLGLPNRPLRGKEGSLSLKLLLENLDTFLKHIQHKEQLTKEDFNSLFGFDPHQEASIRLWKSLDLLAVKKRKNNETEYRDELEEIKENVNKDLLDVDLESFDLDSDMEDLYKQLFPQN